MPANPIDAQFDLRARHRNFQDYFDRNEALSAQALEALPHDLDLPYGSHPLQTIDFFPADAPSSPIAIFIHGGYWRALDKGLYRFLAQSLHDAGCSTSLVNYRLMPDVGMADIVSDVERAIELTYEIATDQGAPGKSLHLCGHSAGGHLALTAAMRIHARNRPILSSIRSLFSLSGLFDLEPIRNSFLNAELNLSERDMLYFSPIHHKKLKLPFPMRFAVGSNETEAFIEQSQAISEWALAGGNQSAFELAERSNHFDIVYDFGISGGVMNSKLLELIESNR